MLGHSLFEKNRKKFGQRLEDGTLALVYSGREIPQSNDSNYPFYPNNNYYYLTGLTEPNGLLAISKDGDGKVSERLFIPRRDADRERWVGSVYTKVQASRLSGLTDIAYEDEAEDFIEGRLSEGFVLGLDHSQPPHQWRFPDGVEGSRDLSGIFNGLRLIKEPEEIELMEKAIEATAKGINEILSQIHPGMREYELAALFEYAVKKHGARELAFDTIAASGPNATTLHYTDNGGVLGRSELMLFDLGARYDKYCADVSRTIPVSGKLTLTQERFYNAVLEAQKKIIGLYRAGARLKEIQERTKEILAESLARAGIALPEGGITEWYYHSIGHSLGLDAHDSADRDLVLEDGMVITCEPGIYAKEYGIGIRIEDDVLINGDEPIVLTKDIPKELDELKRLVN